MPRGDRASGASDAIARAPLALTMGDPAGIGLDITLMAWSERVRHGLPPFVVFGDPISLADRAEALGLDVALEPIDDLSRTVDLFSTRLPVRPIPLSGTVRAGKPDVRHAPATIAAIEEAVLAVLRGDARAVVTNPISKSVLQAGGFAHPGHTEFLGALEEAHFGIAQAKPVMLLASAELKVVPLTVHIPLSRVASEISIEAIVETASILNLTLARDFGIARPRIAVAGLNPHAGEQGTIGLEDTEIIAPAIAALVSLGLDVTGPHSADTLFHAAARETYDAVLAMYHDQALIPIKTLAFDSGVNVTIGLPFVRTSPDHGTAFSIAGTGRARPLSLIEALRLADTLSRRRAGVLPERT